MNAAGGDIRLQRPDYQETEGRQGEAKQTHFAVLAWTFSSSVPRTEHRAFLLLPGAHAVGHAFVEVGRPDDRLYARKPQPLSDFVAHASEGEGDALALQLFDRVQ